MGETTRFAGKSMTARQEVEARAASLRDEADRLREWATESRASADNSEADAFALDTLAADLLALLPAQPDAGEDR